MVIRVEGLFIERFINICISKKILLWKSRRERSTILYAKVSITEYKKLRDIARKTKTKITIKEKKGLPFILHRYRKRKILIFLLLLTAVGLIITSNFIWNIEIKGELSFSDEELIQNLEKEGLKIGVLKSKIDTIQIINNIRLNRNDIAWIGIDIKGTNVIVKVQESIQAPEIIDANEYCDIVSDKSGIITKVNVQNGTAKVKPGDIVQKNKVLVKRSCRGKIYRKKRSP